MDFPIIDLIDEEQATAWLLKYFHPEGLHCPHCNADIKKEARHFGKTRMSQLQIYRCLSCGSVYNLYNGTVFQQTQFTASQAVLLLRGICQGVLSSQLSREIDVSRQTVMSIRRVLQANAESIQPDSVLPDTVVETDEMFQNTGEKGEPHKDPADPPRRRGSGGVRLCIAHHTDKCPSRVMCISSVVPASIQMLGVAITTLTARMQSSVMETVSGRERFPMLMVSVKSTQIRLKVSRRPFATFCVRFEALIKKTSLATLPSVSLLLI